MLKVNLKGKVLKKWESPYNFEGRTGTTYYAKFLQDKDCDDLKVVEDVYKLLVEDKGVTLEAEYTNYRGKGSLRAVAVVNVVK